MMVQDLLRYKMATLAPIRLSLVGAQGIIRPFLTNVNSLRARVIAARQSQTTANVQNLRYILTPEVGTKLVSESSNQEIKKGNVVKARLHWKSLYP
jgi:hypothetical protein